MTPFLVYPYHVGLHFLDGFQMINILGNLIFFSNVEIIIRIHMMLKEDRDQPKTMTDSALFHLLVY